MKQAPKFLREHNKGQIIVILAIMFVGLIAIVGLAVDVGYMYVSYARLRRGVDAAALSASSQFKKGISINQDEVMNAAREFLVLNGIPDDTVSAQVDTCKSTKEELNPDGITLKYPPNPSAPTGIDTTGGDPELCKDPPRKLVRVTAQEMVTMHFMSLVGLKSVPIKVNSISEAASVDVVLVIDRSESMGTFKPDGSSYGSAPDNGKDPDVCNALPPSSGVPNQPDGSAGVPADWTGDCHPFHEVKSAAYNFINQFMYAPYDRVAIVVFDNLARPVNFGTVANPRYLSDNVGDEALHAIEHLWMYDGFPAGGGSDTRQPDYNFRDGVNVGGHTCPYMYPDYPVDESGDMTGPCRMLDTATGYYRNLDCPTLYFEHDVGKCQTTNIGGGLNYASYLLSTFGREEALWVTILLTDGAANGGYTGDDPPGAICPHYTELLSYYVRCRDTNAFDFTAPLPYSPGRHASTDALLYDADDYARDQADILAPCTTGQCVGSLIFSIGLGDQVTRGDTLVADPGTPPPGETLLNYIANKGQTGTYYQATADKLNAIFLAIANKIATRLTK